MQKEPWAHGCGDKDFWKNLRDRINGSILPDFLTEVANRVDEIIEINPDLSEPKIFAMVTRYMVDFLGAQSASVRIYDPSTEQMLSYGSYPSEEESRATYIPLENTIAGEVVKTQRSYLVPNILKEELYQDKKRIEQKGAYSIMAVPLAIPRFFPHERDTVGVIQIYFSEKDRTFKPLEIQMAELMARRLSYVVARRKILSLFRLNEKKEAIVQQIFLKLGARGGVKMKEVFNRVIPELADIINVQSCALFSISEDLEHVVLEAGYPDYPGYHGIGKRFPIRNEPAFELVLRRRTYDQTSPYEVITPSYVLVMDPQKSEHVSKNLRRFAAAHNINSILYVPLTVDEGTTHFMTFDALDQRKRYTDGEIEIFLFLGRELMKAQRMEALDDILHDFKNPAIATAGFARRLKSLLYQKGMRKDDPTIRRYLDILLEETSRLQEMALSIYQVGKEQIVNLTEIAKYRFEINKEAIKEMLKQNVSLQEGPFQDPLFVECYPLHIERILDNLLNNATKAIPLRGGTLALRTYADGNWACIEISNTGLISEEERLRLLEGEGPGRGLYITHRLIRLLKGNVDIKVGINTTTVLVQIPSYLNEGSRKHRTDGESKVLP
ncbi:MAG: GAF domain-containing sensor histidine kinase [Desulfobacteraceae bacterium]